MRISRDRARQRVERALTETNPELKSAAWDSAWSGIRELELRGMGDDITIAQELAEKMRAANKAKS